MKTCPCNTEIFSAVKIESLYRKKFDIFSIYAQNIDCGLKPLTEYLQCTNVLD